MILIHLSITWSRYGSKKRNATALAAGLTGGHSAQPLIPRVLGAFAGRLGGGLFRALAAGNLDCLAAGDFVPGVVGHLPEEIRRYRRDDRNHEERGGKIAGAELAGMAEPRRR